jgi:hypothetical protein
MGGDDLRGKDEEVEIKRLIFQQINPENQIPEDEELLRLDTDKQLSDYILWMRAKNLNSGTWVGTLPDNIRQAYMNQYRQSAEDMARPLLKLKEKGVRILWVEGNEDNRLSLEAISHGLERPFDTQEYFERLGIMCERKIRGFDGRTTFHILAPFFPLRDFETVHTEELDELDRQVKRARDLGKTVIIVAHAQLDWSRHYPGQEASGYNARVAEALKKLLQRYEPDELVYPHQHWEMPESPKHNAKYTEGTTVVTYLPLLQKGELDIPIHARRGRNITLFGGKRHPIRRIA